METKRTELTKHYWNNEGAYETEFSELTAQLMPASGCGKNLRAEVVRAANRLYYEYCNNGNCNACEFIDGDEIEVVCDRCGGTGYLDEECEEICSECDGCGVTYEEGETETNLNQFYGNFIELIRYALCDEEDEKLTDKFRKEVGKLMNAITYFILNDTTTGVNQFTDDKWHRYDLMIDFVAQWALTHEDDQRPIPEWYNNK